MTMLYSPGVRLNHKSLDSTQGTFSGYAAMFTTPDANGDSIEPGAFAKTINETKRRQGSNPFLWPLLRMNRENDPIGGILTAKEDSTGLLITAQCDLTTDAGRAAFSGLQKGYMAGLSIAYTPIRATRDQQGARHLQEISLWAISTVTTGFSVSPLTSADLLSVKSRKETPMNPKNPNDDWRIRRPPFAPYIDRQTAVSSAPLPENFRDERKYQEAYREWYVKSFLHQNAEEPTRVVDKGNAKEHEVGYLHSTHSMEDVDAELVAQRAQRVASGTATLAERMAHYNATGHTPDGRTLPDTSDAINRSYNAIYELLSAARKGR